MAVSRVGGGGAGAGQGAGDFDDLLLALHDPGSGMGADPEAALSALGTFVAHDAAWLGHGANHDEDDGNTVPRLLSQHRRVLPADFLDAWQRIRRFDPLAAQICTPGDHAEMADGDDLAPPLRRFLARYAIGRALCVTAPGLFSEGFLFLSLYRPPGSPPFDAGETELARRYIRHLSVALRNRALSGPIARRPLSAALTLQGRLEHASAALLARIEAQGIALVDGCLPETVMRTLTRRGFVELEGARLMLDYAFGLQILTLADPVPPAVLSPREAEVAAAYATGQGYRDIAAALGISPHTARNHIRTIFRKLGIGSKLELAARLKKSADQ